MSKDQNQLQILNEISHRRFNPLRNSWILVSPHRTKRPWQGQQESPSKTTLPAFDPSCYLCPGNKRAAGDVNPEYEDTFVFVNDYSAVKEEQAEYVPASAAAASTVEDKSALLLQASSVRGKCYVICFNPSHNQTLADLPASSILPIIKTWTSLYASHLPTTSPYYSPSPKHFAINTPKDQYTYMQIFENKGSAMGCSNPHPHGQIWTTTGIPEEPALEIAAMKEYKAAHGGAGLLEDYVEVEVEKRERVVVENEHFVAVCPWWATWPFEVLVVARRKGVYCLPQLTEGERGGLAEVLAEVAKRFDNLFETSFPYSMGIHQAPLAGPPSDLEACHLHIHFYPPLLRSASVRKFLVGYELMAEPQRDITPEQAAEKLRGVRGDEVYRNWLK